MTNFSFSGGVGVIGFISPIDTNDTYAVIDPIYGIDGFRNVDSLSDLHLISAGRRRAGMVVGVGNGSNYYKLVSEPWSYDMTDWETFGIFATGATFINNVLTITNNDNTQITTIIDDFSGLTVNGVITATTVSATTFYGDGSKLSGIVTDNFYTTGFTYSDNVFTIQRNGGLPILIAKIDVMTGLTVNGDLKVINNTILNSTSATTLSLTNLPVQNNSATDILTRNITTGEVEFIPISAITPDTNTFVTGYTYDDANTFTITQNNGTSFSTNINNVTGLTVNGDLNVTGDTILNALITNTISATTYYNLPLDVYVTGGTYNSGTASFTNNSGGTFDVTGFTSTDTYVTDFIYSDNTLTIQQNQGQPDLIVVIDVMSGLTVTGELSASTITTPSLTATTADITYLNNSYIRDNGGVVSIDNINRQLKDSSGFQVKFDWELMAFPTLTNNGFLKTSNSDGSIIVDSDDYLSLTGGTVTGPTNFTNGLSANTISATTYHNLPLDVYVTASTYSNNTLTFTNNSGGTFDVLFNKFTGLTTDTISATTYYNLPLDIRVTGGTYDGGTATFTDNSGETFDVTGFTSTDTYVTDFIYSSNTLTIQQNQGKQDINVVIDVMTGLTVNGSLSASTISGDGNGLTNIDISSINTLQTELDSKFDKLGGTINGDLNVTGNTILQSLTATTISATTYYNLPLDVYVTGGTYNSGTTTFINNSGGTFSVTGFTSTDTYVTDFIYSSNTLTIQQNQGQPDLIVVVDVMTGLTVNGNLSASTISGDGNGLTNIDISSINTLQTELDSKILKPINPLLDDYLYYNGSTWVPKRVKIPVSSGPGYTLFLATSGSTLPGYELLSQIPTTSPEEIESATTNNNVVQIDQYATEVLGREVIDGGIWEFNSFASVDIPSSGLTNIIVGTYIRTSGGVETLLFTAATLNITTTAVTLYNSSVVQPLFDCDVTDRLVVKYSASTTNNFNTVVYLYHGGIDNYSHIHTPFVTLHNDLAGLQGGSNDNYYHLELSQLNTLTLNDDASYLHNHYSTVLGLTGGTVNGLTTFNNGLHANTISATTYQNLPNTLYTGNGSLLSNRIVNIGTNTLNFDSSTYPNNLVLSGGNVGIGTASPSQKLEVDGDAIIRNAYIGNIPAFGTNYMSFSHTSRNGTGDYSLLSDNAGITYLNAKSGNSLKFRINNIDKVIIDSNGNLGVGTTTPNYNLDVNGDGRFIGGVTANTIYATNYENLPTDIRVTGATYSDNTFTYTNNTGGTFNVSFNTVTGLTVNGDLNITGNTVLNTLTTNTISATTYYNLPLDVYVTGGTYNNGTTVFTNNSGGTFDVTGYTIPFSGGSGNCITDFYVTNIHGCSPITIHNQIQSNGSSATTLNSFAFGENVIASGDYSHAEGSQTNAYGNGSHAEGVETKAGWKGFTVSGITADNVIIITGYTNLTSSFNISGTLLSQDIYGYTKTIPYTATSWDGTDFKVYLTNTPYNTIDFVADIDFLNENLANRFGGNFSHTEGIKTTAIGRGSHAEGGFFELTTSTAYAGGTAIGDGSHAEGYTTTALGFNSHAEGGYTTSIGDLSHAEGSQTHSFGYASHAEGYDTTALGIFSHTEGEYTISGWKGFTISSISGNVITISGYGNTLNTSFGNTGTLYDNYDNRTIYSSKTWDSIGYVLTISIIGSFPTEPQFVAPLNNLYDLLADNFGGEHSHAEGYQTKAIASTSHAEGKETTAIGGESHAEGYQTIAFGQASHAEGTQSNASGYGSHAEGNSTKASGYWSHAEGDSTTASGDNASHSEGSYTTASGANSHAEGNTTIASGYNSHSEGRETTAYGKTSHAEGSYTTSIGENSHSEGLYTTSIGDNSRASGYRTISIGNNSFVHGTGSTASGQTTIVLGNNITGTSDNTIYVSKLNINTIGVGTPINNLGFDSNGNVVKGTSFTGGTVSGATIFTNGLTANTISATTISGGTLYGDGSKLTGIIPPLSQGQIFIGDNTNSAAARNVVGDININYTGNTTIQPSVVTYAKIQNVSQQAVLGSISTTGGTVQEIPMIEAYINSSGTTATLLSTTSNWDINGVYIGTAITGTVQGQSHYNGDYWFTAIDDNLWIRMIRG